MSVQGKLTFTMLIAVSAVLLISGCRDLGSEPATPMVTPPVVGATVSFQNNVKPILARYGCTGCHGGTNGLYVDAVSQLKQGGIHGPAITPLSSAGSLLVKKISPTPPFGDRMPQGGPYLPDSLQQVISTWIDQGALDN
jgi:hypothetical protein